MPICVQLTGELSRAVFLELILSSDTADTGDFDSGSLVYSFDTGSRSGDSECNVVNITRDDIVEVTEQFSVELHGNLEDHTVIINQSMAVIFIEDSSIGCK